MFCMYLILHLLKKLCSTTNKKTNKLTKVESKPLPLFWRLIHYLTAECWQTQHHNSNFFGVFPVERNFAAVSSTFRDCSFFLASMIALLSSPVLCISATLFFIFSAYPAFFFSYFSYAD